MESRKENTSSGFKQSATQAELLDFLHEDGNLEPAVDVASRLKQYLEARQQLIVSMGGKNIRQNPIHRLAQWVAETIVKNKCSFPEWPSGNTDPVLTAVRVVCSKLAVYVTTFFENFRPVYVMIVPFSSVKKYASSSKNPQEPGVTAFESRLHQMLPRKEKFEAALGVQIFDHEHPVLRAFADDSSEDCPREDVEDLLDEIDM